MSISFGSINTGLPKDIVQRLMQAERIPVSKMEQRKAKMLEKGALVDQLSKLVEMVKANVEANGTNRSLKEITVETKDEIADVQVDKNVVIPGTHQLEVISLAKSASAMTNGFSDPNDSYVGVGYIRYDLPSGEQEEVFIGQNEASLNGIARKINQTSSGSITATVVNDGSGSETPWRINLALSNMGDDENPNWPYLYFVDGDEDLYLEFERPAKDAKLKFNGFEMEASSNKVESLIPGAVINLKKASPGEEFSIKITEDTKKITEKISSMVENINGVFAFIKEQNQINEATDTSRTLGGDIILQSLESRLRAAIFTFIDTSEGQKRIGDYGINFQKSGLLNFDTQKFEKETKENYQVTSEFLVGRIEDGERIPGFIDQLKRVVDSALQFPNGILRSRKTSLKSNIQRIDNQIKQKERFLARKEDNLKQRFSRLESTISSLKSQGAGLSALGAGQPNIVQQLG